MLLPSPSPRFHICFPKLWRKRGPRTERYLGQSKLRLFLCECVQDSAQSSSVSHSLNPRMVQRPRWACAHFQRVCLSTVIQRCLRGEVKMRHYHPHPARILIKRKESVLRRLFSSFQPSVLFFKSMFMRVF